MIFFFTKKSYRAFPTFRGYIHKYTRYSWILVDIMDISRILWEKYFFPLLSMSRLQNMNNVVEILIMSLSWTFSSLVKRPRIKMSISTKLSSFWFTNNSDENIYFDWHCKKKSIDIVRKNKHFKKYSKFSNKT